MHHGYYMMGNWGGFGGGALFAIIFWAALIILFVLVLTKALKGNHEEKSETNSTKPLEIAKERYAKGEITKKEYEEMKKELK